MFENVGTDALVDRGFAQPPDIPAYQFDVDDWDSDADIVVGGGFSDDQPAYLYEGDGTLNFVQSTIEGPIAQSLVRLVRHGAGLRQWIAIAEGRGEGFAIYDREDTGWRTVFSETGVDISISQLIGRDLDGDDLEDLVVVRHWRGEAPWFYRQLAGGGFERAFVGSFGLGFSNGYATPDLDGDGDVDVLLASGDLELWLYDSAGGFAFVERRGRCAPLELGVGFSDLATGDFDGDGRLDIALTLGPHIAVIRDAYRRFF